RLRCLDDVRGLSPAGLPRADHPASPGAVGLAVFRRQRAIHTRTMAAARDSRRGRVVATRRARDHRDVARGVLDVRVVYLVADVLAWRLERGPALHHGDAA